MQNQSTLDGSSVAQTIIKFMHDKEEYVGTASELHKKLESVAEDIGISIARDKAWPKSARWLWRRIKEVLPLLATAGIEASREHTDKGTDIALRKVPRNVVSNVRKDESGEGKGKTADNSAVSNVRSNVRKDSIVRSNVRANPAKTKGFDNTDIRNGGLLGNACGGRCGRRFTGKFKIVVGERPHALLPAKGRGAKARRS